MADFSSYGGASDEWLAVAATLPTPPEQSLEELKAASNANREKAAAEQMKGTSTKPNMFSEWVDDPLCKPGTI